MSYGTIVDNDTHPDLEPGSSSRPAARRPSGVPTEKLKVMGPSDGARDDDVESDSDGQSQHSAQAGVKRAEAIASTWSKSGLYLAYLGVCLFTYATSLENQTTGNLTIYATSAFSAHSLVSTVLVVQGVILSVVKPPISKIADVFGRFEAFTLSVLIYSIGYVQQAASDSVETYAAAQIFYAAGQTGLQILVQIFIADTSDLTNRAVCATLPYLPFLANVWLGSPLADKLINHASWRWGYGIWAIVVPIAYLPLALSLYLNQRKAARRGLLPPSPFKGQTYGKMAKHLWFELDCFGMVLLCAAFALLLIPLTLAASKGWTNPNLVAMLVVGGVCLALFPLWESSKRFAPRAFFPPQLLKNRTILAGIGISFFYFMAYYMSIYPYYQSYLLVVQGQSVTIAGRIVQMWTFSATVSSFISAWIIRSIKRYRFFVTGGACVYLFGLILMLFYRVEGASTAVLAGTTAVVGMGGGMINIPAQLGMQASASHGEVAAATAIFLTFLEIGGAVGSAISGAIWTANVPKKLAMYLPPEAKDQAGAIYSNITLASTGWPMGSPEREAINRAYQETMTKILLVACCVAVPIILLSLLMKDYKLDEIDQHVRGVVIGAVQDSIAVASSDDDDERYEADDETFRPSTDSTRGEEEPMLRHAPSQNMRKSITRKGS